MLRIIACVVGLGLDKFSRLIRIRFDSNLLRIQWWIDHRETNISELSGSKEENLKLNWLLSSHCSIFFYFKYFDSIEKRVTIKFDHHSFDFWKKKQNYFFSPRFRFVPEKQSKLTNVVWKWESEIVMRGENFKTLNILDHIGQVIMIQYGPLLDRKILSLLTFK